MKIINIYITLLILVSGLIYSQDTTTVEAKSESIAENLDLEAVVSVFGESESLEDFEKRLNDPELKINNLDLNGDKDVDYLRVLENGNDNTHVVTIQAVIGKDKFQDVATIDIVKDEKEKTKVQVVGDVELYGSNYIIQPVYVQPPVIVHFFWSPMYHPWHSPYYWGYYPSYYHPWRPYPPHVYRRNVHVHINVRNSYRRTNVRYSSKAARIKSQNRRNDFKRTRPTTSVPKTRPATKVSIPSTGKIKKPVTMPKTRPTTSVPRRKPAGGGFRRRR